MANMDPAQVFTPSIQKHSGADNVVIVKVARGGQPIRRWFKDWKVTGDQNPAEIGDLFKQLIRPPHSPPPLPVLTVSGAPGAKGIS